MSSAFFFDLFPFFESFFAHRLYSLLLSRGISLGSGPSYSLGGKYVYPFSYSPVDKEVSA